MASPNKHSSDKIPAIAVATALSMLVLEEFLPWTLIASPALSHVLNFFIIFTLVVSLACLLRGVKRRSYQALTDLSHEMTAMRRQVDQSAWRYKCLLEGAGNAIFIFDAETGVLQEVNRKATELLGYPRDEMMALNGRDFVVEEDREEFSSLVMRVVRRGRGRCGALRFKRANGTVFYAEIEARLIDLVDCRVAHVMVRDVTYKQKAEREIRQRNHELSVLMGLMARANQSLELQTVLDVTLRDTIEVLGADGGTIHLVDQGREYLCLAATHQVTEDLAGGVSRCSFNSAAPCLVMSSPRCHSLEHLDEAPCLLGKLAGAQGWNSLAASPILARDRLIGVMHIFTRTPRSFDGEKMDLYSSIGSQIGIVIAHARLFEELNARTDELLRSYRLLEKSSHHLAISQRKLNRNLALFEHTTLELGRLDKMKNQFLGMISHEFRTPLTGIMSGTEFLLDSLQSISDDERKILQMIHDGGRRLNEIVSDLLKIVRLEAKGVALSRSVLHLSEIVDQMQEQFTPFLRERCQHLEFRNIDELPYFNGDREYIEEVFTKLLENAAKFTPDGGEILVTACVADRRSLRGKEEILLLFNPSFYQEMGDAGYLQVEVRDAGVGIEPQEQVRIFEKFYETGDIRFHSTGKHKFQGKGAGLGLAIVKGMVEAHGGMVWVESPSCTGRGSSFFVLLPLEEEERQAVFPFMSGEPSPPSPCAVSEAAACRK